MVLVRLAGQREVREGSADCVRCRKDDDVVFVGDSVGGGEGECVVNRMCCSWGGGWELIGGVLALCVLCGICRRRRRVIDIDNVTIQYPSVITFFPLRSSITSQYTFPAHLSITFSLLLPLAYGSLVHGPSTQPLRRLLPEIRERSDEG